MGIRHVGLIAVLGLGLTACWRHNTPPTPAGGHDIITLHELERVKDLTLFDAVRQLRPHFLRNRTLTAHGRGASSQLMLYVNGEKMDSVDDLRRLWPSDVEEVRFYEPQLANTYFARYNNAGGAIAVKLRKLDG
jgi:hypothetical protein